MEKNLLNRTECDAMRGIAIIGIALHNYCHWLRGIVRENEYLFSQNNVDNLGNFLSAPDWNLPIHLLSFFGHYGVPVFLFLSAYGLVRKYEGTNKRGEPVPQVGIWPFIRYHFLKLFKLMFVGFVAFLMLNALSPDSHHYKVEWIIAQLGMFINFFNYPERAIWPGPYWFFGLMLQLYIIYRVVLYRRHWGFTVALMIICHVAQMLCQPESETLNYLRYNFVGGMLPFGMGLLTARYGEQMSRRMCTIMILPSLFMVYYFSQSFFMWSLAPLTIIFTVICIVKSIGYSGSSHTTPLLWTGRVSAAMFICHPITRKLFIPISYRGDTYSGLLLYIISTIALSWLFVEILKRIPSPQSPTAKKDHKASVVSINSKLK